MLGDVGLSFLFVTGYTLLNVSPIWHFYFNFQSFHLSERPESIKLCRLEVDFECREVPQIIGTTSAMWISDFEIFAKNLFYT